VRQGLVDRIPGYGTEGRRKWERWKLKGAKLSFHQRAALEAIRTAGGVARPEGGGWWKDEAGHRLIYAAEPGSTAAALCRAETVSTTTIYALVNRGLLVSASDATHRGHHTYVIPEWVVLG
jgi:hypothetical protein